MVNKKILVTGIVSKAGLDKLMQKFDVSYSDTEYSRSWILAHLHEYDGLLLMGQKADKELIDSGKNLKIISVNGVGFDHVDINYAKSKGIIISNSPQSVRIPTAEMTFALLMATTKRLFFYDKIIRNGDWIDVSKPKYQGISLSGKTLGIYGMGRIGKTVAALAQSFGMNIIYNDYHQLDEKQENELNVEYVDFNDLLLKADVITIHAPLLDSTRNKFDEYAFSKMKSTAYLINAARGPIVKEDALVHALTFGQISGAGLDVFEFEPKVSEDLRRLDNVILTPHAGTGTVDGRREIAQEASDNLIEYFNGNPVNVVNN